MTKRVKDRDIVERCLSDRNTFQGSFRDLYDRHARAAYRFLVHMVGRDRAADCLQETFFRVYKKLDTFDLERPFRPWLFAIARNVALDLLRKASREPEKVSVDEEEVASNGLDPVADEVSRREVAQVVRMEVGRLPDNEREVFLMKQVEGLTFPEVANALDCSVRTVKYRMRAACDRLATILKQRGIPGEA